MSDDETIPSDPDVAEETPSSEQPAPKARPRRAKPRSRAKPKAAEDETPDDEPETEEPKAEEPKAEEPKVEEPEADDETKPDEAGDAAADEPDDAEAAPTRDPRRWWKTPSSRIIIRVAGILAIPGLVAAAYVWGWVQGSDSATRSIANPGPSYIEVPVPDYGADDVSMPDVRGLVSDDAMQVLADAGIPVYVVTTEEAPSAGAPGIVIAQTPAFGSLSPAAVTLTISAAAVVPEVAGKSTSELTALFASLGTDVEIVEVYKPTVPVYEVISVEPPPGSDLPESVTLTVSAAPGVLALSNADRLSGSCSTGYSSVLAGVSYSNAVQCSVSTYSDRTTVWLVSRKARTFAGMAGIPDTEDPGTTATAKVFGDGHLLGTLNLTFGEATPFSFDVSAYVQVSITLVEGSSSVNTVWVDSTFVGDPGLISELRNP